MFPLRCRSQTNQLQWVQIIVLCFDTRAGHNKNKNNKKTVMVSTINKKYFLSVLSLSSFSSSLDVVYISIRFLINNAFLLFASPFSRKMIDERWKMMIPILYSLIYVLMSFTLSRVCHCVCFSFKSQQLTLPKELFSPFYILSCQSFSHQWESIVSTVSQI